jgi:hypothetical protein
MLGWLPDEITLTFSYAQVKVVTVLLIKHYAIKMHGGVGV